MEKRKFFVGDIVLNGKDEYRVVGEYGECMKAKYSVKIRRVDNNALIGTYGEHHFTLIKRWLPKKPIHVRDINPDGTMSLAEVMERYELLRENKLLILE